MISHWQDNIKQTNGYILISFKHDLSVRESLDPTALNKILKSPQQKAKLHNIADLSGHSFRVGAVVDLLIEAFRLKGSCGAADGNQRRLSNDI